MKRTQPNYPCFNGIDDDEDQKVDFPDPGCESAADPREVTVGEAPQCANADDDGMDWWIIH